MLSQGPSPESDLGNAGFEDNRKWKGGTGSPTECSEDRGHGIWKAGACPHPWALRTPRLRVPPTRVPAPWQWETSGQPLPSCPATVTLSLAEIGVGITGFGVFFILFGILLYFDSVLLAFGNVSPQVPCTSSVPNSQALYCQVG